MHVLLHRRSHSQDPYPSIPRSESAVLQARSIPDIYTLTLDIHTATDQGHQSHYLGNQNCPLGVSEHRALNPTGT